MAAVSVFVDDAVRGRLPLVCAKSGEPADLVVRVRHTVGNGLRGWAWLLVLFGPPGWLALLVVLLLAPADEHLTVRVPHSRAAYDRERLLERLRLAAFGLGLAAALAALAGRGMFPLLWLALVAAFFVAAVALHAMISFQAVRVSLDASRRWVTLSGVHPAFVRAVEERQRLTTTGDR